MELAGELWGGALGQSICRTRAGVRSYLCHAVWELSKQYCVLLPMKEQGKVLGIIFSIKNFCLSLRDKHKENRLSWLL